MNQWGPESARALRGKEELPMKLYRDPSPEQIEQIFAASQHNAAKWLEVPDGTLNCWAAEEAQHAFVARLVNADV